MIDLIAALDRRYAIGRGNALPWHLPDDLRRFKALTLGKTVLMGRKTAQSLGRALPGRRNLVLTRAGRAPLPGMEAVPSIGQDATELKTEPGAAVLALRDVLFDQHGRPFEYSHITFRGDRMRLKFEYAR